MSVTKRQSFKYSIIGYMGVLIGTLSIYFLFPYNYKLYGKLRYILTTAEIFLPIVVFGISYANVKFFHLARKNNKHQNLLSLSLLMMGINFTLFLGGFFIFHKVFTEFQDSQFWKLKNYILPLILILSFSAVFNKYISNFRRIAIPNIFENLFPKMGNILAFCLILFVGFQEKIGIMSFVGMFILALIGYIIYTHQLEKLKPNFNTDFIKKNNLWKDILEYSFFGFLGNLGNYIAIRIDSYMIGEYIGYEENGIYLIIFAMISLISIPQMGLYNISAPIINEQMETGKMKELDQLHKQTSLTLFFVGSLLFSCLTVGFPYLTHFIKNGNLLLEHQIILWILGLATLFDLATGFNGNILSMSKYYRINILFMLGLATFSILLNFYFIKNTNLGIIGVAIATGTSLTLYNLIKLIFNYRKFNIHPLTWKMLWTILLCGTAIFVTYLLPDTKHEFLNLIYKSLLCLGIILKGNDWLKIFPLHDYLNSKFIKNLFRF